MIDVIHTTWDNPIKQLGRLVRVHRCYLMLPNMRFKSGLSIQIGEDQWIITWGKELEGIK